MRLSLISISLFAALAACSGIQVRSDYTDGVDFDRYTTYSWQAPEAPSEKARARGVSELVMDRIHSAIDEGLGDKGLSKVVAAEDGLLVTYHISIEEKLQFNDPYFSYDRNQSYDEGTLLIDLIDAKTGRLVWRGSGLTRIKDAGTPEARTQRIRDVVAAILAEYPPKS